MGPVAWRAAGGEGGAGGPAAAIRANAGRVAAAGMVWADQRMAPACASLMEQRGRPWRWPYPTHTVSLG